MSEAQDNAFQDTLAKLETALERPVVPGELEAWSQDVLRESRMMDGLLRRQVEGPHRELLESIEHEDDELMQRVEQMKEEDREIRRSFDEFVSEAGRFAEDAPAIEPDEAIEFDRIAGVSDNGLALVIRIRKQELAIETWQVESAWRDRGVQD